MFSFFDESGKLADSDFVCMAGYLSDDARWNVFVEEWKALLRKYEIPAVHMKLLMPLRGPFEKWLKEYRDKALGEFIDVIRRNTLVGFGVGVNSKYLRSMKSEAKKRIGDPQMLCFQRIMRLVVNKLSDSGYDDPFPVAFDDSEEYAVRCYRMWSKLRATTPELKKRIASISFADDEVFLPLQGADILAHQSMNYLRNKGRGIEQLNNHFRQLLTPQTSEVGIEYISELWDGETLEELDGKIVKGEVRIIG